MTCRRAPFRGILLVVLPTVCAVVRGPLRAEEYVTEALFADSTFIKGPLVVESETLSFLKVRFYRTEYPDRARRRGLLPRNTLRYLVYGDWAVPYRDGAAQRRIPIKRTRRYPRSGLLLFGLASFCAGAWMHVQSQNAEDTASEISGAGTADLKRRHERRRERFELYSGLGFVAGFGFSITGLTWKTVWELSDGHVVLPRSDGRYQISREIP